MVLSVSIVYMTECVNRVHILCVSYGANYGFPGRKVFDERDQNTLNLEGFMGGPKDSMPKITILVLLVLIRRQSANGFSLGY